MSSHCLQNHEVDVAGKIAITKQEDSQSLCPLSFSLSLPLSTSPSFISQSCSLFLYFSLGIIVFINIYQCWSLLARIIVCFWGILYSSSRRLVTLCVFVCVCVFCIFSLLHSFSLSLYCIISLITVSLCLSGWITYISSGFGACWEEKIKALMAALTSCTLIF